MNRLALGLALLLGSCAPLGESRVEHIRRAECAAETTSVRLHIDSIHAWNDFMPIQTDPQGKRYLIFTIECRNLLDRRVVVELVDALVFIEDREPGERTSLPSVEDTSGQETGYRQIEIAPGATIQVPFRGRNLYSGVDGKSRRLHVTLGFWVDGEIVWLRRSCPIFISQ